MASIQFSGLASGLDTQGIIDAMLRADQSRIELLQKRQSTITSQVSAIGTLKSKLSTLDAKMQALRFANQVLTYKATTNTASGSPTVLTATADSTAAAGSFNVTVSQLATQTRQTGLSGISDQTISLTNPLASAGMALTPTAGKFTVAGVQIDASSATSVQDFVDAINNQQSTVIAEAVDAAGNPSATPVKIRLTNAVASGNPITVGSAGDTSNFLKAAKLDVASQTGDQIESTTNLGRIATAGSLSSARLATAVATSGTMMINGVPINWTDGDSLNAVVSRINSSAANVTASYDQVADRVVLSAKNTGAQSITVSDSVGNLAAALGIDDTLNPTEALGLNATFSIDTVAGGATQTSTSNTVTGVVPGVTLNLQQSSLTPVTVTVAGDATAPLAAVKEVVTAFNDVLDFVRNSSRPDANGNRGAFQGDMMVRMLADQLRSTATSRVTGLTGPYASLADLGITTGAVGSAIGTTNSLVLDEAAFTKALEANAQGVYDVLNNAAAGSTGVFTNLRNHISQTSLTGGLLQTMTTTANTRKSDLSLEVTRQQERLDRKRARLEAQFARMESALTQIQSQGQRLQTQLGGLTNNQGQ